MILLRTGEKLYLTVSWLMNHTVPLMTFKFNKIKINGGIGSKDRPATFRLFSWCFEMKISPKLKYLSSLTEAI